MLPLQKQMQVCTWFSLAAPKQQQEQSLQNQVMCSFLQGRMLPLWRSLQLFAQTQRQSHCKKVELNQKQFQRLLCWHARQFKIAANNTLIYLTRHRLQLLYSPPLYGNNKNSIFDKFFNLKLQIQFYLNLQQNYHYLQSMAQSHEKVFRSPINTSISKNLYSFPKSDRFQKTRESPCRKSFYNVKKGTLENRSTSFGYGNKTDLINREGVPPPGSYQRFGEFGGNRIRNRGYSFGLDKRETFSRQMDLANPGPGKYDRVYNNYSRISFSFRSKYEDPLQKHKNHLGPGQYNAPNTLNNTGSYYNSKYRGSLCGKIGKSSRFEDEPSVSPGPGKYSNNLAMNKTGVYFNSRIPSNFVKSFHGTARLPINDPSQTPGPGTYYYFSDFAARSKSPAT